MTSAPPPIHYQHDDDVADWINRFKAVAAKPETLTAPAPQTASPWFNRLFGCFEPIDTCTIATQPDYMLLSLRHLRENAPPLEERPLDEGILSHQPILPRLDGRLLLRSPLGPADPPASRDPRKVQPHRRLRDGLSSRVVLIQQDKEAGYHVLGNMEMVNTQPPAKKTESMSYPA
ncbi:hypothetical protein MMC14_002082 [Varicellaria rhodocarpa]|nr:hypothetical protein [Varicellaria rhodocarpa]